MSTKVEFFDLYDATGRSLGMAKPRELVHRDGDWHRSVHIWIFTSAGQLLFQRRSATKDTWPCCLDASIGGHYRAGETTVEAIRREAHEELGLSISDGDLVPLGGRAVESVEPTIIDREWQDLYLSRRDLPLNAYSYEREEIDGLVLLDTAEAARLHRGEIASLSAQLFRVDTVQLKECMFTINDIIPGRGSYLTAVAQAVKDLLAGRLPQTYQEP